MKWGVKFVAILNVVSIITGCAGVTAANRDRELVAAIDAAKATCDLPRMLASVNCYEMIEREVWQRDDPDDIAIYDEFAAKWRVLAQRYDNERAPPDMEYNAKMAAAVAQIRMSLPQVLKDPRSPPFLKLHAVEVSCSAARPKSMVEYAKCLQSGQRPIFERDAPAALPQYDVFAAERLSAAGDRDSALTAITRAALDRYNQSYADLKKYLDIRLQTARQAANARALEEALNTAGNLIGAAILVSAVTAIGYEQAKYGQPQPSSPSLHCQSRTVLGTTNTDCQ